MFEKEAEKYTVEHHCKNCWLKDADEEHKCTGLDFCSRHKDWQRGAEFGYNKANEWHYMKDGKLPKTGNPCLVYLVNDCVIVARLREDNVWTTDGHNAFENVIAWKEIELPKETKEND